MATVIDFSASYPSPDSVRAAGHDGVMLYLSPPRESWMGGKKITKQVVDDYKAAGLKIAVCWQYGKGDDPATADTMRGAAGGRADAEAAQAKLTEIGLPGHPVFFCVDFDITLNQWNSVAVEYFKAAGHILGRHRVGIYGHSRVVHWAMEDQVVATVAPGRVLGWVTRSWSGSFTGERYAVLFQRIHNTPGPDGVLIDINDVHHDEWGWRPLTATPAPETPNLPSTIKRPGWRGDPTWLPDALRAFGVEVKEEPGWENRGQGDFLTVWGAMAHHTASNNTPTSLIRDGRADLRGMLSQIHLLRDGVAIMVGQGIAWHAGRGSYPGLPRDNANFHTIGIEANQDGFGPWPDEQLDAYYRTCAAICWVLDKSAADGVVAHREYSSEGKPDPAPMDMGDFRRRVQYYIDNPPFMQQAEKEALMSAFDKITDTYPSRVEGSDVELRPLDALFMADANSFIARANTVTMIGQLKETNLRLSRIEALLIKVHSTDSKEAA